MLNHSSRASSGHTRRPYDTRSAKKERWRNIFSTASVLVLAPFIAIVLTTFIFQSYKVEGMSMEQTLHDKDRLIIWKTPRTIARLTNHPFIPERYDIVVLVKAFGPSTANKQLIKRVIGLPGDRVILYNGKVTIYNDKHSMGFDPDQGQEYAFGLSKTPGDMDVIVPADQVFVLGDNRSNSHDSTEFGPIPVNDIIGKLALRLPTSY